MEPKTATAQTPGEKAAAQLTEQVTGGLMASAGGMLVSLAELFIPIAAFLGFTSWGQSLLANVMGPDSETFRKMMEYRDGILTKLLTSEWGSWLRPVFNFLMGEQEVASILSHTVHNLTPDARSDAVLAATGSQPLAQFFNDHPREWDKFVNLRTDGGKSPEKMGAPIDGKFAVTLIEHQPQVLKALLSDKAGTREPLPDTTRKLLSSLVKDKTVMQTLMQQPHRELLKMAIEKAGAGAFKEGALSQFVMRYAVDANGTIRPSFDGMLTSLMKDGKPDLSASLFALLRDNAIKDADIVTLLKSTNAETLGEGAKYVAAIANPAAIGKLRVLLDKASKETAGEAGARALLDKLMQQGKSGELLEQLLSDKTTFMGEAKAFAAAIDPTKLPAEEVQKLARLQNIPEDDIQRRALDTLRTVGLLDKAEALLTATTPVGMAGMVAFVRENADTLKNPRVQIALGDLMQANAGKFQNDPLLASLMQRAGGDGDPTRNYANLSAAVAFASQLDASTDPGLVARITGLATTVKNGEKPQFNMADITGFFSKQANASAFKQFLSTLDPASLPQGPQQRLLSALKTHGDVLAMILADPAAVKFLADVSEGKANLTTQEKAAIGIAKFWDTGKDFGLLLKEKAGVLQPQDAQVQRAAIANAEQSSLLQAALNSEAAQSIPAIRDNGTVVKALAEAFLGMQQSAQSIEADSGIAAAATGLKAGGVSQATRVSETPVRSIMFLPPAATQVAVAH